jgi:conjugal transfer pilus assembly protein TraU
MTNRLALLAFSAVLGGSGAKDQLQTLTVKRMIISILILTIAPFVSNADTTCRGRFVNPITDICWSCIMPISIGGLSIGKGQLPKKRDTKNPSFPACMCTRNNIPTPGITIGFWEPVRLIDVTRTPYCMVNLGGISLGSKPEKLGGYSRSYESNRMSHYSFYHLHYYVYPLIYWLELITDFACLEKTTFDVAYMSEFDITWNDSKLQSLLNPEVALFANPIAKAACALDCASSTIDMPSDAMFWCVGCSGSLYPFSGANGDHVGGVKNSNLLAARIIAKMHRVGIAEETSTDNGKVNGPICRKRKALRIKKSQYKLQMLNPKSTSKDIGCWPLGYSDMLYNKFKEYPGDGEDWGYLLWRKRNCCMF